MRDRDASHNPTCGITEAGRKIAGHFKRNKLLREKQGACLMITQHRFVLEATARWDSTYLVWVWERVLEQPLALHKVG